MVKFKSRYILLECLYEEDKVRTVEASKWLKLIRTEVESLFGDVGLGKLSKNLQVKYVNNMTNMMIIRVGKDYLKMLWTVLTMVNNIDGEKIKLHIVGVSGTIKKCELKAKKYLQGWTLNYEKYNK
jgi:RNase P/RNase MRP subunit POP5